MAEVGMRWHIPEKKKSKADFYLMLISSFVSAFVVTFYILTR
jgi:hypothetical protein